jgi:hypothetical protein
MTTLLNYRTQNYSLPKLDTWIASTGKPLNFKCTHKTSTEKRPDLKQILETSSTQA